VNASREGKGPLVGKGGARVATGKKKRKARKNKKTTQGKTKEIEGMKHVPWGRPTRSFKKQKAC